MKLRLAGLIAFGLALHGCDSSPPAADQAEAEGGQKVTAPTPGPAQQTVDRQVLLPSPGSAPAADAIQTQPGPDGSVAQLTSAVVAGDILTVQMQVAGPQASMVMVKLDEVNVVDETTSQRSSVLRDNSGKWMASHARGEYLVFNLFEKPVIWLKFPAPAPASQTISINIPKFGTFVKVPVQR